MGDCMSVREKIEKALDTLCYRTSELNKRTLLDVLEHTISYQRNCVVEISMNSIHTFVSTDQGTTKKAIESRLNRCKVDFIMSLPTGDIWTLFGVEKYNDLKSITEHQFVMAVSRYVVSKW